jgi:thioredoxin 1
MTGSMDLLRIVIVVVVVTIGIQTEEICAFAPSVSITTTTTTALSAIAGLEEPGRTVSAGLTCARVGGTVSFSSTGTKGKTAASSSSLSLSPVSERIVAAAKAAQNNEQAGDTNVISVTDTNYRALFNSDQPLLLDAYAQWCGPCKLIAPILEDCAQSTEFRDRVVFGKFDVEDKRAKEVKLELLLQGVMPTALPSLLLIQHNEVVATWNGVINTWELHDFLHPHVDDDVVTSKGPTNTKNIDIRKMTSPKKKKDSFTAPEPKPFRGIGLAYDF